MSSATVYEVSALEPYSRSHSTTRPVRIPIGTNLRELASQDVREEAWDRSCSEGQTRILLLPVAPKRQRTVIDPAEQVVTARMSSFASRIASVHLGSIPSLDCNKLRTCRRFRRMPEEDPKRNLLQGGDSSSGPVIECCIPEVEVCRWTVDPTGRLTVVARWTHSPDAVRDERR